jgi:hypothetical protein
MRSRVEELADIDRYISACGITRCPDRFTSPVIGAFSPRQEAQRIAALQIAPPLTRPERIERLGTLARRGRSLWREAQAEFSRKVMAGKRVTGPSGVSALTGDRGFESISLQQRVRSEPGRRRGKRSLTRVQSNHVFGPQWTMRAINCSVYIIRATGRYQPRCAL